ncbi:hypothetical protein Csa_023750, partial [Cucumis sativus]
SVETKCLQFPKGLHRQTHSLSLEVIILPFFFSHFFFLFLSFFSLSFLFLSFFPLSFGKFLTCEFNTTYYTLRTTIYKKMVNPSTALLTYAATCCFEGFFHFSLLNRFVLSPHFE